MPLRAVSFDEANISGEMELCLEGQLNEIALWIANGSERECDRAINSARYYVLAWSGIQIRSRHVVHRRVVNLQSRIAYLEHNGTENRIAFQCVQRERRCVASG